MALCRVALLVALTELNSTWRQKSRWALDTNTNPVKAYELVFSRGSWDAYELVFSRGFLGRLRVSVQQGFMGRLRVSVQRGLV